MAQVPYLPSSKDQTLNTMKLLEGRTGRLADLGSGDGRLVSDLLLFQKHVTRNYSANMTAKLSFLSDICMPAVAEIRK